MKFAEFGIALVFFVILIGIIGEPYGTWLTGVVILGSLYLDAKSKNSLVLKMFEPKTK